MGLQARSCVSSKIANRIPSSFYVLMVDPDLEAVVRIILTGVLSDYGYTDYGTVFSQVMKRLVRSHGMECDNVYVRQCVSVMCRAYCTASCTVHT